jgi:hypothetical protein
MRGMVSTGYARQRVTPARKATEKVEEWDEIKKWGQAHGEGDHGPGGVPQYSKPRCAGRPGERTGGVVMWPRLLDGRQGRRKQRASVARSDILSKRP